MTGTELLHEIEMRKEPRHQFIKWWRKENDFTDIEMLDSFSEGVRAGDEFGGFELLGMEELWSIVDRLCNGRVVRRVFDQHEDIVWDRVGKDGVARCYTCSFAPEFLIQIFDVETRGNYIE